MIVCVSDDRTKPNKYAVCLDIGINLSNNIDLV